MLIFVSRVSSSSSSLDLPLPTTLTTTPPPHAQVGHMSNGLSSDVCDAVLATSKLFSPSFDGVLRRCYPYANLTDLSFLENKEGYIAGVTNPMFSSKDVWWDLLCDMESGRCTHSSHSKAASGLNRRRGASGSSGVASVSGGGCLVASLVLF